MGKEKKTWHQKEKEASDRNDPKNPNAGVRNGERAKKVTGKTPGETDPLPLRKDLKYASAAEPQASRGPAMSPQALGAAITQSAKQATEAAVGPFRWAAQNAGAAKKTGTGLA